MRSIPVFLLLVIVSMVAGCIFSINDDYDKSFSTNGNPGGGEFTISGVIIDSSGKGVPGLQIDLTGGGSVSTTTDGSGAYSFDNVAAGSYVVGPPANSYAPMAITVTDTDVFVGTVRRGGHGGNENGDYSCTNCH